MKNLKTAAGDVSEQGRLNATKPGSDSGGGGPAPDIKVRQRRWLCERRAAAVRAQALTYLLCSVLRSLAAQAFSMS